MSGPRNHPQSQPQPPQQQTAQKLDQFATQMTAKINEHAQALEMGILRDNQQQQIIDQYRAAIYNLELKFDLLIKMFEEKGIMAKEEFGKRWPLYLKNEIGVIGPEGRMEGSLKVSFYGE
jgi:flagellar biosynthesis/type III secretory pathway protein FliH